MKVAIIGSREYKDKLKVWAKLSSIFCNKNGYPNIDLEIISGGARGVDTWAVEWAKAAKINISIEIIKPINPTDKFSYLLRNVEIITKADKIIAFWDGKSRGTKFVIDYAKAREKDIEVFNTEIQ